MEKSNYKYKNIETNILKKYAKEPISTGEEQSFSIRKRFYRIDKQG